ncbi:MAG: hypothetical protein GX160_10360 [Clostridiales bacterium]|nr:hypothetical protein [Clostridiales bacterium]
MRCKALFLLICFRDDIYWYKKAIVSFSNLEQLEQAMKSCELELDEETVNRLRRMKKYAV